MVLLAAVHSVAGTFHSVAAAWVSIMRAAAPPLRTYSCDERMPRLPPVEKSPHTRLRRTLSPGVGYSVLTLDQSASSSSATSWASPVTVPWPISDRTTRTTILSSGLMSTRALVSGVAACACARRSGMSNPSARPPAAAVPITNERRLMRCDMAALRSRVGRGVDRSAHLLEGATATDIGDRAIDVRVRGLGPVLEQRRPRHDHSCLAIATLRHIVLDPGLLHLVQSVAFGQPFDRRDVLAFGGADGKRAGAHSLALNMNCAGAALGDAAAILGAGQTNLLANDPQQRSVWVRFDGMGLSVDDQPSHSPPPTVVGECRLRLRSCIACQHSLNVGALERASAQYVRDHANVSEGIMGRLGSGVCAGARWLCVLTNWLGRWRRLASWPRARVAPAPQSQD